MHHGKKHRTRKHKSRRMRGGKGNMFPINPESVQPSGGNSGANYVNGVVGNLEQQTSNALVGNSPGNQLVVSPQKLAMTGGRRRRNRRGGYFGSVVSDAVVPLGLLAVQQTYGRKSRKSRKSRRTRRR
jgi:hypothetical protein